MSNPGPGAERRRYVRMDTVFPVEMAIAHSGRPAKDRLQGFTHDVSMGGLCLEFHGLSTTDAELLRSREPGIELWIHVPFRSGPFHVSAQVAWIATQEQDGRLVHKIGVQYSSVQPGVAGRIVRYARIRQLWPRLLAGAVMLLGFAVVGLIFSHLNLIQENRRLVSSIVTSAQNRDAMIRDLEAMASRQRKLAMDINAVKGEQNRSATAMGSAGLDQDQLDFFNRELAAAMKRESDLRNELALLSKQRRERRQELRATSDEAGQTQEEMLGQFVSWIERHAHAQTGLVPSYQGDPKLEGTSFTYDQALSALAFTLFKKNEAAAKILSFYKDRAVKSEGGYVSSYDAPSGQPVEWNVHVGPNVWIGLAALQYQRFTGDSSYAGMAQAIGNWLLELQAGDPERGLRGGPKDDWFSTEHNLDAYAFFGMLHRSTGDPRYLRAQEETLAWLLKHAADRRSGSFKRGKGDATIATDTFSWSIAAIGPAVLAASDFDPEGIMEFAEEHCRVEVDFERPDGRKVRVTGFDFAKPQNQGRGGVVSTEWTAQAVVTFRVLESYFESLGNSDKADYYRDKSRFYLNELQKMIISSPSRVGQGRGCLPYASAENAETGHGWRTPSGDRTGSVAGTAYGIFAWTGFNPFDDTSSG